MDKRHYRDLIGLLMATFAILGSGAAGAKFYIDSVNGSDSNHGLSQAKALKTIAALGNGPLVAGNTILLAAGSTWREKLIVPVDGVIVDAYGSGAAPILDCSDVISSGSWTKTAGLTNVYQVVVAVEGTYNIQALNWAGVWCNGTRLVQVADQATCDSTAGSYFPSSTAVNNPTYYVHAPGDTDPRVDGKTYEYANRSTGLDAFNRQNCTVRNIRAKRNYQSLGSITMGQNCVLQNCRASEGNTHNVYMRAGSSAISVTADECYNASTSPTLFVHYETDPGGANMNYTDCIASLSSLQSVTGYYGHCNTGNWGTVTYTRCTTINCSVPYGSANTTNLVWAP